MRICHYKFINIHLGLINTNLWSLKWTKINCSSFLKQIFAVSVQLKHFNFKKCFHNCALTNWLTLHTFFPIRTALNWHAPPATNPCNRCGHNDGNPVIPITWHTSDFQAWTITVNGLWNCKSNIPLWTPTKWVITMCCMKGRQEKNWSRACESGWLVWIERMIFMRIRWMWLRKRVCWEEFKDWLGMCLDGFWNHVNDTYFK